MIKEEIQFKLPILLQG